MTFKQKVLELIRAVPAGKVVSYGQIAAAAGSPRAARQVGGILRSFGEQESTEDLPWWRVINNQGLISIKGNWTADKRMQKQLLVQEGIPVTDGFKVDIEAFRHTF